MQLTTVQLRMPEISMLSSILKAMTTQFLEHLCLLSVKKHPLRTKSKTSHSTASCYQHASSIQFFLQTFLLRMRRSSRRWGSIIWGVLLAVHLLTIINKYQCNGGSRWNNNLHLERSGMVSEEDFNSVI